mmetsp:Transcript_212/g.602  ORF Transcript_212/g.602 Transcript_212/m.602 type:complete len:442 (-) Transcript_212:22-1347(-)
MALEVERPAALQNIGDAMPRPREFRMPLQRRLEQIQPFRVVRGVERPTELGIDLGVFRGELLRHGEALLRRVEIVPIDFRAAAGEPHTIPSERDVLRRLQAFHEGLFWSVQLVTIRSAAGEADFGPGVADALGVLGLLFLEGVERLHKALGRRELDLVELAAADPAETKPRPTSLLVQLQSAHETRFRAPLPAAEAAELGPRVGEARVQVERALEAIDRAVHLPVEVVAAGEAKALPRGRHVHVNHQSLRVASHLVVHDFADAVAALVAEVHPSLRIRVLRQYEGLPVTSLRVIRNSEDHAASLHAPADPRLPVVRFCGDSLAVTILWRIRDAIDLGAALVAAGDPFRGGEKSNASVEVGRCHGPTVRVEGPRGGCRGASASADDADDHQQAAAAWPRAARAGIGAADKALRLGVGRQHGAVWAGRGSNCIASWTQSGSRF